jgi:riboflavin kinase/FMN adenylyltransferase
MRATFELGKLEPAPRGAVVSIGVFDGIHLGHQAILAANLAAARHGELEPTVVTFRRHPKRVLLGRSPKTLTSLQHRLELFRRAGIEHAVVLRFTPELRAMDVVEFVERIAVRGLAVRRFVLGFDSKFARDREGTPERLGAMGFAVDVVPEVHVGGKPVSSTAIREAVELGDLKLAARMLGRRVSVLGRVVRGNQLGRKIGFPTANLDLHHELHPPPGVYAVVVVRTGEGAAPKVHPGVCNIGFRPTVAGTPPALPQVEVHLLDFAGDLYGARLELGFVARLRTERRFPNLDALKAQIQRDADEARAILADIC